MSGMNRIVFPTLLDFIPQVLYIAPVVTLSSTQARTKLSALLKRAAKGEDIGILHGGMVIALRPVAVHSEDYALMEYGVTKKELSRFAGRVKKEIKKGRKQGKTKVYSGDLEADIAD